jgi:hypothetical protein
MERDLEDGDEVQGGGGGGMEILDSPLTVMVISEVREANGGRGVVAVDRPTTLTVLGGVSTVKSSVLHRGCAGENDGTS